MVRRNSTDGRRESIHRTARLCARSPATSTTRPRPGLVRRPRLLMLDEPSAGLSPVLVDRVLDVVQRLREAGTAVLLVEQLIEKALALADRVYALARGSIVLEAKTDEADLPRRLEHAYMATAGR